MLLLPDPARIGPPAGKERNMTDLVMVALGVGGFVLLAGYGALCDRL